MSGTCMLDMSVCVSTCVCVSVCVDSQAIETKDNLRAQRTSMTGTTSALSGISGEALLPSASPLVCVYVLAACVSVYVRVVCGWCISCDPAGRGLDCSADWPILRGLNGGTFVVCAGNLPAVSRIIDAIQRKKTRDNAIVGVLIATCICFTIWYVL
jgi:hypothetical protein